MKSKSFTELTTNEVQVWRITQVCTWKLFKLPRDKENLKQSQRDLSFHVDTKAYITRVQENTSFKLYLQWVKNAKVWQEAVSSHNRWKDMNLLRKLGSNEGHLLSYIHLSTF